MLASRTRTAGKPYPREPAILIAIANGKAIVPAGVRQGEGNAPNVLQVSHDLPPVCIRILSRLDHCESMENSGRRERVAIRSPAFPERRPARLPHDLQFAPWGRCG